eukprot:CAMPEP_0172424100 /NCGR_PEP_ID=MMETSP1064-20121228/21238_1 /TAXON_ID=202472 /ORGANISM="Aulacoseira subarctica , Strain CCAP 1002/5" /LENGTH=367 /DNA_ID=CAMNT_0013165859 /DNA_START=37 /DNA_END=1137 /DNA_ORIENTATION=-
MKRNRWDSSDDEEGDENYGAEQKTVPTKTSKAVDNQNRVAGTLLSLVKEQATTQISKTYSPLLSGCRYLHDCYERLDVIAEGTYGIVWRAKDLSSQEIVALKQMKNVVTNEGFPVIALREVQALLDLSHECIVSVREVVVGNNFDKVFMVMPYLEMDLRGAMELDKDSPFPHSTVKIMLRQILAAVGHVHERWYMHRDIKPSNFLLNGELVKLCDFGLARKYHDPLKSYTQPVVTLWYRPPELLFGETKYGPEVDMWSVGCVFAELLTKGVVLLQGEGELAQISEIFTLLGAPTEKSWPNFSSLPTANLFHWKSSDSDSGNNKLRERFQVNAFAVSRKQAFLDEHGLDLLSQMLALNPRKRISAVNG